MAPTKILICGDVLGNFGTLFAKVIKIHVTKGPFDSLYCVGNFFGNNAEEYEDLKSGKIIVPITTYILNGNELQFKEYYEPLADSVPNIVYLGKMGCLTGISGIKVAYLSGVELPSDIPETVVDTSDSYNRYFSRSLVKSMINLVGSGTDILLTSQWPKEVTNYCLPLVGQKESKMNENSSHLISHLARALKPRYHFCGMAGFYYERIPYRNHVDHLEKRENVTCFIALGPVTNNTREKWLYAISLNPANSMTSEELAECYRCTTVCPYTWKSIGNSLVDNVDENFFFGPSTSGSSTSATSASKKRLVEDSCDNKPRRKPKKKSIDESRCWFCLSNENVEKHLIIVIGEHCYVTLAKGVLVPEHVFIVPINHIGSSVQLSPKAFKEMEDFKDALTNYFYDRNKDVVFFERSHRSPHLQIQVVPIPKNIHTQIEDKFHHFSKSFNITKLPAEAAIKEVMSGESRAYLFFEVIVDRVPHQKYMFFIEKSEKDFPLQIGRIILAEVLDLVDRINWQTCVDSDAEKMMAKRMKENFQNYDFTAAYPLHLH